MSQEKKQNLQDVFLNAVRKSKTPLTIFLVNGVKLQGIVTWFDNFCLLLRRDGQSIAYTIKDGHAVAQQLELGRSLGNDREVLAGLAAGQRVIVDPPAQLAEGSAVREAEAKKP